MFGATVKVLELLAERERVEAALVREVGVLVASGEWAADGAGSATGWLVQRGGMAGAEAARLVRNGRLVHHHERTAKLLDRGEVTSGHVDVLARAARHREVCFAEHEETLLDAARSLAVEQFRTVARRWRVLADDVATDADATHAFEARHLHCSVTFQGSVRIDGLLDPDGGARFLAALDAYMDKDPQRCAAQRRADALVRLAAGDTATTVTVDVLVDAESLVGQVPADLHDARSDLARVGPVAPSTVRRLACDGLVGRIIRQGSEILDVGRRQRLATPGQWRAVRARDGGCVVPDCDAPPEWCDVHHLHDWAGGGGTDLDNLVLVCRRHHVACHEGRWTLHRRPDTTIEAIPP